MKGGCENSKKKYYFPQKKRPGFEPGRFEKGWVMFLLRLAHRLKTRWHPASFSYARSAGAARTKKGQSVATSLRLRYPPEFFLSACARSPRNMIKKTLYLLRSLRSLCKPRCINIL